MSDSNSYQTNITVAFGDTDPAGLVYYPNLLHYCHVAMERFFAERCGVSYSYIISKHHIGFPTVKLECDFVKPFVYGDQVEVFMSVTRIGQSSVHLTYQLAKAGIIYAEIRQVHVCMALQSRSSTPIPENLRQALNKLL